MSLPDFLIIGAMKCGTSTLAAQLAVQPGVFMSNPKEPNFFSDDPIFAKGLHWYKELFLAAGPNDIKGEASTHYTKLPTYPETVARMQANLDAPRLVYMVRDPVQRAVSHYVHEWTERRMAGSMAQAIKDNPEVIEYGMYAKQIAPFIAAFGKDAMCLTSLERLKANPQAELSRVADHIGVVHPVEWQADLGAQNVSSQRIRKMPFHRLIVDNPVAEKLRRTLVPKRIRQKLAASRQMDVRPQLTDDEAAALAARFASDQTELNALFPGVIAPLSQEVVQ